ncbi:MAG: zinc ABC transporter substrate-binding protein [Nitrospirae bacterium]|nr:zinc ABC transporter substrate-binding protein [Nitrospirota bacterium]
MRQLMALLVVAALCAASCQRGKQPEIVKEGKRLTVVTSLFPLFDFARNVGKEKAEVLLLLPPGVEPHSFEPKPGDIARLNTADIFIYTSPSMEPWVRNILKGVDANRLMVVEAGRDVPLISEAEGSRHQMHSNSHHDSGGADPHIWLDLGNAAKMVDFIMEAFAGADPENRAFYKTNAEGYKAKLSLLDMSFKDGLSACGKDVFINGGHFAFGYLARRYNLKYLSAYGFSPDAEPSPRGLVILTDTMKKKGLRYIFHEELIEPRVAETIGKETGAALLRLHGGHNITKDELARNVSFLSLMEKNLENLRKGLECR